MTKEAYLREREALEAEKVCLDRQGGEHPEKCLVYIGGQRTAIQPAVYRMLHLWKNQKYKLYRNQMRGRGLDCDRKPA